MRNSGHEEEQLWEGIATLSPSDFDTPEASDIFRESLLARTSTHVQARPRRRRMLTMAFVGLAYCAGLATMSLRDGQDSAEIAPVAAVQELAPKLETAPRNTNALTANSEKLAYRVAMASEPEQRRLLKAAGDQYLLGRGDPGRATQCYGRLLDLMETDEATTVTSTDNWLLATLKLARLEEKTHVQSRS